MLIMLIIGRMVAAVLAAAVVVVVEVAVVMQIFPTAPGAAGTTNMQSAQRQRARQADLHELRWRQVLALPAKDQGQYHFHCPGSGNSGGKAWGKGKGKVYGVHDGY